jgi:hypothetical protein
LRKTAEDRSSRDIILEELIPTKKKKKKSVVEGSGSSDTM